MTMQTIIYSQPSLELTIIQIVLNMNHPNDSCAICSKQPEDMLLLECSHNLCLDCATQLFAAAQQETLQCEICFVQTRLDEETISCLSSLAEQVHRMPYRQTEPTIPIPRPPKEVKGLQCSEHREKALYYCFDCQVGTICSECILGTTHTGHKVLTLKKASTLLIQSLVGQTKQLEDLRIKLDTEADGLRVQREELVGELQQRQRKLKLVFDDMMRQVGSRYNQLSSQLEKHSLRSIQITQGSLNATNEKIIAIDATIKQNQEVLERNDTDAVLKRFTQLQAQIYSYKPDVPALMARNDFYLRQEDSVFVQLESLLQRITWEDSHRQKDNRIDHHHPHPNIRIEGSLLDESGRYHYPELGESQLREKEMNQSVNRYSNIKGNSRRLELSRSMDNATNIINKLQERLRK